ncbi:MAG: sigma 54-interacting transcriptional regulator [Bacillota bacterium]|nr:sigma 54-interacting transcriptional regulator [Bacillota bacterium]MDW7682656.1 sigma 54-interacting transcriptional regulator [Bacillota bacterium]
MTEREFNIDNDIFKLIVDQLDGVVITDKVGRYVYVNDSWKKYMGLSLEEVRGKYVKDVMPFTKIEEALRAGKKVFGNPTPVKREKNVKAFSNYIPIYHNGEIVAGFIHVIFNNMQTAIHFSDIVNKMANELDHYKQELKKMRGAKYSLDNIIGESTCIQYMKKQIQDAARSVSTVLIEGETGSGKELIAHAIHDLSSRSLNPLVKINCAAIPQELLESEFFGYEEGAFTGARKGGNKGKLEFAQGGSFFLDEINQLSLPLQPKLLRVLQEREIERVGGTTSIPLDVRFIVATNTSLEKLIKENKFRSDLFYRLNVINIKIPPLRNRKEDIPLIVENLVSKLNFQLGMSVEGVTPEVNEKLQHYNWPGNIRELQNVVERAINSGRSGVLGWNHFREYFDNKGTSSSQKGSGINNFAIKEVKRNFEKEIIAEALRKSNYNKTRAAKVLGISRVLLYRKIREYEIEMC